MPEQDQPQGIGRLAAALAKAQAELKPAARSRKNSHLGNQYSTLEDVWTAIREPLAKHGLAVVQTFEDAGERAAVVLVTHLIHTSGEQVTSSLSCPVVVTKGLTDVQALGSAISYLRRYSLAAMVGVVSDEDDDGASAPQQQRAAPAHEGNGRARATQAAERSEQGSYVDATMKQARDDAAKANSALFAAASKAGVPTAEKVALRAVCSTALNREVEKVSLLPPADRRAVADWIEANAEAAQAVAASAIKAAAEAAKVAPA